MNFPRLAGFTPGRFLTAIRQGFRKIALIALVILAILALQKYLPLQAWLQNGTSTFRDLGAWGVLLFLITYAVLLLLFAPVPLLSITAGTLYGLGYGYLAAAGGSLLGAALAFLIAHLFRKKAREWVSRYQTFKAVEGAGRAQPMRTLLSVHTCPLFPMPIADYMAALAGIPFPLYLFGAWLGGIPGILFYVYVGDLGGNLALEGINLGARDLWMFGAARVGLWMVSVAGIVSFGLLVKRYQKKV
jgi:uncharacterized membrane protein YdjX (TVP38/TMEM64 family)